MQGFCLCENCRLIFRNKARKQLKVVTNEEIVNSAILTREQDDLDPIVSRMPSYVVSLVQKCLSRKHESTILIL